MEYYAVVGKMVFVAPRMRRVSRNIERIIEWMDEFVAPRMRRVSRNEVEGKRALRPACRASHEARE